MLKKGVGVSFNTITLAVIGIIALLVIITIFTGKSHLISKDLSACESKGGTCQGSCTESFQTSADLVCAEELTCCIDVYDQPTEPASVDVVNSWSDLT